MALHLSGHFVGDFVGCSDSSLLTVAAIATMDWKSYTIDLWKDNGDFTITGIALTTMGGKGSYDKIELLKGL